MDYTSIYKELDNFILNNILHKISSHYNIPIVDLQNVIINKETKQLKKKTSYQNFFAKKTNELKHETKDMSFGEISKYIAQLWNGLSKTERDSYCISSQENKIIVQSKPDISNYKLSELKSLCLQLGLKPKRTRQEMTDIILDFYKNDSLCKKSVINDDINMDIMELEDSEMSIIDIKSNVEEEDEEDFTFRDDDEDLSTDNDDD